MKDRIWKKYLFWIVVGILCFNMTVFADVAKVTINQIVQKGNDVYMYVNTLDSSGEILGNENYGNDFTVSINKGRMLPVTNAEIYETTRKGVSYTFCIDISKSVTEQEMNEIKSGILSFIGGMNDNDYVRIITIGQKITSLCDLTKDHDLLKSVLNGVDRTDNKTFLYEGISYALEGHRRKIEDISERAAIIVFTDGMDDSDGAFTDVQVEADSAETRIPIYVVGLKGNDPEANLNSVGLIANHSGGKVISYNDKSISEAVEYIDICMNNAYEIQIKPEDEMFGTKDLDWRVTYSSDDYSVTSSGYIYSLGMENVVLATPTPLPSSTPTPTPEPTTTPTPSPTPTHTPTPVPTAIPTPVPTKTPMEQVTVFMEENLIICIAAGLVVIALIIIIVSIFKRNKNEIKTEPVMNDADGQYPTIYERTNREETIFENVVDDEKTIDEISYGLDDEATIYGDSSNGLKLEFLITFDGRTENVKKTLKNEIVLGRGEECDVDVVLHSIIEERKQTSRKHAVIVERHDGLYVQNNSKNKTYLNGMEVDGEMALKNEDVLQLGRATVKVKILGY